MDNIAEKINQSFLAGVKSFDGLWEGRTPTVTLSSECLTSVRHQTESQVLSCYAASQL